MFGRWCCGVRIRNSVLLHLPLPLMPVRGRRWLDLRSRTPYGRCFHSTLSCACVCTARACGGAGVRTHAAVLRCGHRCARSGSAWRLDSVSCAPHGLLLLRCVPVARGWPRFSCAARTRSRRALRRGAAEREWPPPPAVGTWRCSLPCCLRALACVVGCRCSSGRWGGSV